MSDIIILYPAGLGGHHLSNIISLSTNIKFNKRFDNYNKIDQNVHNALDLEKNESNYNVLPMHIPDFFHKLQTGFFQNFQNYKIVVLNTGSDPENDLKSIAGQRWYKHNFNSQEKPSLNYFFYEISILYQHDFLEKILKRKVISISAHLLFNEHIDDLLKDLEEKLELKFANKEYILKLHLTWIEKVFKK